MSVNINLDCSREDICYDLKDRKNVKHLRIYIHKSVYILDIKLPEIVNNLYMYHPTGKFKFKEYSIQDKHCYTTILNKLSIPNDQCDLSNISLREFKVLEFNSSTISSIDFSLDSIMLDGLNRVDNNLDTIMFRNVLPTFSLSDVLVQNMKYIIVKVLCDKMCSSVLDIILNVNIKELIIEYDSTKTIDVNVKSNNNSYTKVTCLSINNKLKLNNQLSYFKYMMSWLY